MMACHPRACVRPPRVCFRGRAGRRGGGGGQNPGFHGRHIFPGSPGFAPYPSTRVPHGLETRIMLGEGGGGCGRENGVDGWAGHAHEAADQNVPADLVLIVHPHCQHALRQIPALQMHRGHARRSDAFVWFLQMHSGTWRVLLVLGYWVGVRRPFRLSLFLAASRMILPQDP